MRIHPSHPRQRGSAAVEFGIVLALLVTLLAGIFGFGRRAGCRGRRIG